MHTASHCHNKCNAVRFDRCAPHARTNASRSMPPPSLGRRCLPARCKASVSRVTRRVPSSGLSCAKASWLFRRPTNATSARPPRCTWPTTLSRTSSSTRLLVQKVRSSRAKLYRQTSRERERERERSSGRSYLYLVQHSPDTDSASEPHELNRRLSNSASLTLPLYLCLSPSTFQMPFARSTPTNQTQCRSSFILAAIA